MAETFLFVGCLNRDASSLQGTHGLAVYAFKEESLSFEPCATAADIDNPSYLSVDPANFCVYANSEIAGWREGVVSAYRFDPAARTLTYLNKQPTLGSVTAHNSITADGRFLLVANYGIGTGGPDRSAAVLPIAPDGSLLPAVASIAHAGTGPNPERQERPHTHCIIPAPDGAHVFVADLGLDQVFAYRLDRAGGLDPAAEIALPPGAGPRHIAVHPDGETIFVACELDSTVHALRWRGGRLAHLGAISSLPPGTAVTSYAADIHLSPDGRFAYASNRGDDSIAVIGIAPDSRKLMALAHTPSGGAWPRSFALTPSGRHLLVANQNSDTIVVFARDAESGLLRQTGGSLAIATPTCVKFGSLGR